MSLQIWLPLIDDLHNQGLNGSATISGGSKLTSGGKLGAGHYKVYNGAGLTIAHTIADTTEFTFAYWLNIPSSITSVGAWNTFMYIPAKHNDTSAGMSVSWASYNQMKWYDSTGYDLKLWLSFSYDTWYHIAVVHSSGTLKIYINGELGSRDYTMSQTIKLTAGTITIGGGMNATNAKLGLQDFRLYNKALSASEVKEISKGLVLHYPLRGPYIKNLNPYVLSYENYTTSDYADRTTSSIINGVYHVNGYLSASSIDTSFSATTKNFITLLANTDYYLSFYCKTQSANALSFGTSGLAYTGLISNSNTRHYPSNYVDLGTNFDGFVVLKIRTSSDTLYKINLGFDSPNIFGVGSFIEFHSVMLSLLLPSDYVPYEYNNNIVYDSSGYNNNGTIFGTLTTSTDTPRYDKSTQIISGATISHPLCIKEPEWTCSCWIYPTSFSSYTYLNNLARGMKITHGTSSLLYINENPTYYKYSHTFELNKWQHVVFVFKHSTRYMAVYKNGVKDTATGPSGGTVPALSSTITLFTGFTGYVSDYREYCTALSEDDVKDLYQEAAFIDNKGDVGCYLFEENVVQYNMLGLALEAISKKQFNNLLVNGSSLSNGYVQLVDEGLRIYKAPNISGSLDSGGTRNWCGMVIRNTNNQLNLENNHTYVIMCDIKGHSETNLTDTGWRHSVGWNYPLSGIVPHPSNVVIHDPVVSGFNSDTYKHYSYKFTINDGVYKVATSSYLAHTEGLTYLSYNDFKIGYTYSLTGPDGTEIYINNLRMFDITSNVPTQIDINKQGLIEAFTFTENGDNAFIDSYYGMNSNQLIEI